MTSSQTSLQNLRLTFAASSSCIEFSALREAIGVTASSGSRRSLDDYARHADDDDDIDMVRHYQQTTVSGASPTTISSDHSARESRERSRAQLLSYPNGDVIATLAPNASVGY